MADQAEQTWKDRFREWRRERRDRSIDRQRRRSEHLRHLERTGKPPPGEYDYNDRNIRSDWPSSQNR